MRQLSTNRELTRAAVVGGLVVVLLFLSMVSAEAAVIRVATTGSNVAGCGSVATPCGSLQYALDLAVNDDEIRVAEGTYSGVSSLGGHTQLAWIRDKRVTVRGGFTTSNWTTSNPVANPTILDAQGLGIVLYVTYSDIGGCRTTIEGFEITGGNATTAVSGENKGGGVHASHTVHMHVTLDNCWIHDNAAESSGGGVFSTFSPGLEIKDSIIENNTGGAITATYMSFVDLTDSIVRDNSGPGLFVVTADATTTITGNTITGNSPGIKVNSIEGTISNNTINGNTSTEGGGGIKVNGSNDLTISNNNIFDNESTVGGALYLSGVIGTVENNTVRLNRVPHLAYGGGGGFYLSSGDTGHIDVIGNTLEGNTSSDQGGGMTLLGHVDVFDNRIIGNTAYSGGGIVATTTGTFQENRFIGNSARTGGGLRLINPMGVSLIRNLFRDNHATNGEGGGAYLWGAFFFDVPLLDGNRFIDNTSTGSGGGLFMESQDDNQTTVTNLLVQGNVAGNQRSGMYQFGVTMDMSHSTFVDNVDSNGDGIGFYSTAFGDEGDVTMTNCIVAGQKTGIQVASGDVTIDRMLWGGGAWANDTDWTGGGVLTSVETWADPQLMGTGGEGYHIGENSPARDAGIDIGVLVDMDGEVRPDLDSGIPDLGADEWSDQFDDIFADGFENGGTTAWD